ncbi:MAG: RHS repeat-associated core domain-containing protein, partial [Ferruginibacter sp.]
MNRLYLKNDTQNSFFGYELGYSDTLNSLLGTSYQKALYNGNITGTVWRSKGDGQLRKYDYSYDAAGRLLSAAFTQFTDGAFNLSAGIDYSVMMGNGQSPSSAYDANGNILYMVQYGLKLGSSALIDRLSYAYTSSANKLARVTDAVNDPNTRLGDFKDGANTGADDYLYDVNGNLTQDLNKGIANIVYNQLNLPEFIDLVEKGTVRYTYTAAGTRLKKQVFNRQTQITITTLYLSGFVYETKQDSANNVLYNNKLLFCGQEEGRIRALYDSLSQPGYITGFACDYFIKDHLGNIRAVITSQKKEDQYPPASMETAQATTEEALYANLPQTRTLKTTVPGYPADTYTSPNDYVAKVSGDGNKIGPSITLKVMAGDKFNIRVTSWYRLNGAAPGNPVNPLTSLLAAMQGGVGGAAAASHGATIGAQLQNGNILTPAATQFLNSQTYNSQKPKAFINWILLDEQFQYTAGGFEQAGNNEELKEHIFNQVSITKTGYLYVYVSNATPNIEVFFDNLQLTHSRGTLLETNEYYPFGLLMKNISYRSQREAGFAENKYKYNAGTELNEELDVQYYETPLRNYDPQTGRFNCVDMLAEHYFALTPYQFGFNNPVFFNDPTGALTKAEFNKLIETLWGSNYGGHWSAKENTGTFEYGGGSYSFFGSADEAFGAGAGLMADNGWWGLNKGWATNFESALQA